MVEAWNDSSRDDSTGVVTYESHYRIVRTGEVFSATSEIVFTSQADLAALVEETGLHAIQWLGDWRGAGFSTMSPEIIPMGRLAP